jgi:hypothetical protein
MLILILAPASTGLTPRGATPQTFRCPNSHGPGVRFFESVTRIFPVALTDWGLRTTEVTM